MGALPVELENVYARYAGSEDWIVKDVTLKVDRGEMVVIMGPSGCGKSTLINVIGGLIPHIVAGVVKGKVKVEGIDVLKEGYRAIVGKVGIVYQNPEIQVITRSVFEELAMAPENLGLPRDEIIERVNWALEILGLKGYERRDPQTLSGGEKQLVAIASVLTMQPRILMLDEPTSMLDHEGTRMVLNAINNLRENTEMTVIVVEHRVEWAVEVADRIIVMDQGKIVLEGSPAEVFSREEEVKKFGVRPPSVSEVAYELRARGVDIPVPVRLSEAYKVLSGVLPVDRVEER